MKRAFQVIIWSVVVALGGSILGCGSSSGTTTPSDPVRSATNTFGPLAFTISTPHVNNALDTTLPITVTVVNTGTEPAQMNIGPCDDFTLRVSQATGQVWLGPETACAAIVRSVSLAPGETRTYNYTWNETDARGDIVPPGTYTLTAQVSTNSINGAVVPSSQITNSPISINIVR